MTASLQDPLWSPPPDSSHCIKVGGCYQQSTVSVIECHSWDMVIKDVMASNYWSLSQIIHFVWSQQLCYKHLSWEGAKPDQGFVSELGSGSFSLVKPPNVFNLSQHLDRYLRRDSELESPSSAILGFLPHRHSMR